MKAIQQNLKCNNLSLNEAMNVAQNHPLWSLETDVYVCCYAVILVLDRKERNKRSLTALTLKVSTIFQEIYAKDPLPLPSLRLFLSRSLITY